MNLSLILPNHINTIDYSYKKQYRKDYIQDYVCMECMECMEMDCKDCENCENCLEWSLVCYDFMDNKDILEENIEKGEQLEKDMRLVIEGRLFSSNFEKYFEKIRNSIIIGLKKIKKDKYNLEEIFLLNKHAYMFDRLNKLCQTYSESKKIWWN